MLHGCWICSMEVTTLLTKQEFRLGFGGPWQHRWRSLDDMNEMRSPWKLEAPAKTYTLFFIYAQIHLYMEKMSWMEENKVINSYWLSLWMEVILNHRKLKRSKWQLQILLRNLEKMIHSTRNPRLCGNQTRNLFFSCVNGTLKSWSHKGDEMKATITSFSKVFIVSMIPLIYLSTNGRKLIDHPNTCRLTTRIT